MYFSVGTRYQMERKNEKKLDGTKSARVLARDVKSTENETLHWVKWAFSILLHEKIYKASLIRDSTSALRVKTTIIIIIPKTERQTTFRSTWLFTLRLLNKHSNGTRKLTHTLGLHAHFHISEPKRKYEKQIHTINLDIIWRAHINV